MRWNSSSTRSPRRGLRSKRRTANRTLGSCTTWRSAVFFVVDESTWTQDIDGRVAIHEAFARFVAGLGACEGVEVNQELSQVISGAEFTWQAARATDGWNFANLSHREP
jgi:hypothetical protein